MECRAPEPFRKGRRLLQDSPFSDEFCGFIQTCVPSVEAAETLVKLSSAPQGWWDPSSVRDLEHLRARGLIEVAIDGRVRFCPASEALAAHAVMLAQAYNQRPVTLFRLIYALRKP